MKKRSMGIALLCAVALLLCSCVVQPSVVPSSPTTTTATTVTTTATVTQPMFSTAQTTTSSELETTTNTVTASTTKRGTITTVLGTTAKRTTTTTVKPTTTTVATTTTVTTTTTTTTTRIATTTPPTTSPVQNMIGAWVSYLELNILLTEHNTPDAAKRAIDELFVTLKDSGINTIFFHVRANSDAYYDSALFEPSAAAAPLLKAGLDPLAYAIESAHKKGMQLHAWVNPYRVGSKAEYAVIDIPTFQNAAGAYYYVPTSTAAQELILQGVRELLQNYAVDGIQYDDYFYPSGVVTDSAAATFEIADYNAYRAAGGTLSVGDWRRENVNALIASTHTLAKNAGKVFGVSPAHDADATYENAYADTKKWLGKSGYVDYLCPQIYFGFENTTAPFDGMVETWLSYSRHSSVTLCVGVPLYKIGLKNDPYAGDGKTEWTDHSDVMKRTVLYLRSAGIHNIFFYSATFFDPDTCRVADFTTTNDLEIAKQEIQNLKTVL